MSKCRCNCHDPAARKAMKMREHKSHRECQIALKEEAEWLRRRESDFRKIEDAT